MVSNLYDEIEEFLIENHKFREPLQKIIINMLDKCKYLNGDSVERHNFGNTPSTLNDIPDYNQMDENRIYEIYNYRTTK
jgi:hypothetical protein